MAVEGTLDLFKLPEILQLISQQKKTGILTVQGQQDIVAISFLAGRIVAADALNQTLEEGLVPDPAQGGDDQRAGPRPGRRRAPGVRRAADRPAGRAALHRAAAAPRGAAAPDLPPARAAPALEQGDFKFYSGDEVSYEEGFVPISVEELLINSAQDAAGRRRQRRPRRLAPLPPLPPLPPVPPPPRHPAPAPRRSSPAIASAARPGRGPSDRSPASLQPARPPCRGSGAAPGWRRPRRAAGRARSRPPARRRAGRGADRGRRPVPSAGWRWRRASRRFASLGWVGRSLAVLLTVLVAAVLLRAPTPWCSPSPGRSGSATALVRDQRGAALPQDRPRRQDLVPAQGELPRPPPGPGGRRPALRRGSGDPEGRPLQYSASEEGYTLQPLAARQAARRRRGDRGDHRQLPARPRVPQRLPRIHGRAARPARLGLRLGGAASGARPVLE